MSLALKVITRLWKVAACNNKRHIIVQYKPTKRTSSAYKASLYWCMQNTLYSTCMYNRLPEDEPSGSKHVEDIEKKLKIKILI